MAYSRPAVVFAIISVFAAAAPATAQSPQPIYQTPADISDFPPGSEQHAQMLERWNLYMTAFAEMAITGNPWSNVNDAPRENFLNLADAPAEASTAVQPITWTAFPNKVNWYFSTSQFNPYGVDAALIYPLADEGRLNPNSPVMKRWVKLFEQSNGDNPVLDNLKAVLGKHPELGSDDLVNFAPVRIPTKLCPVVNWQQDPSDWVLFSANISGPRGWKDEYNEWVVTRDGDGNITKVAFTAENPEYWFTLWEIDPYKVLELYRKLVNSSVELEDLVLRNPQGAVLRGADGKPVYNPLNRWNYGNEALPDRGGAVHLTSPPNTVGAEIYLGAAATMIRDLPPGEYSPANNLCTSQYGGSFRNSDPNIGMQANQVTRNIKHRLTLTNPIALYMQWPDFSNYETPDGTPAEQFFTVVRGRTAEEAGADYDQILHATFAVPAGKGYDYKVSDITIGGANILWGSQIAETFNQALAATAYLDMPLVDTTAFEPVADNPSPDGWAQPLVEWAVFWAVNDSKTISAATIPLLPYTTTAGTRLESMALEVISGSTDARIEYVGPDGDVETGIEVEITDARPLDGSVTGKHGIYDVLVYQLNLSIDANVRPGLYGVRVTNPGNEPQVPTPGNLIILEDR